MTMEEKLEMYEEKKKFIDNISAVFQASPAGSSVSRIDYELYKKLFADIIDFREWLVVHFDGGGRSARLVSCNSNTANFRVLGPMLDGGYYEEMETYKLQEYFGYEKVEL